MNKKESGKRLLAFIFFMVPAALTMAQTVYTEETFNKLVEWPTPNPLYSAILEETFQDWPNTRTYSSDPLKCNDNNRQTQFNWANYRVRRFSGETEYYASMYLHNVEIQPFCDTQSGVFFALDPTNVKAYKSGNDHLGASNPGVSVGTLTVLDTTSIGGVGYTPGYIVIGQMNRVKLIQYTTSNFGSRRGFKLEYSYDQGKTWIMLRNERGQVSTDSTTNTSGFALWNSPKGLIWEENVNLSNVMLRFSRSTVNAQIFRIHDIRIYGRALSADMNDTEFETNSGLNWGEWMGVSRASDIGYKMLCTNGMLQLSEPTRWVRIYNLAGRMVRYEEQAQYLDLTNLPKGVYLVKACNENDRVIRGKVVR